MSSKRWTLTTEQIKGVARSIIHGYADFDNPCVDCGLVPTVQSRLINGDIEYTCEACDEHRWECASGAYDDERWGT